MERRPQKRVRNSNTRTRNTDRRDEHVSRVSSSAPVSQKVRQIYLDADTPQIPVGDTQTQRIDQETPYTIPLEDTQRLDWDSYDTDDLFPEETSYHEERMARKAQSVRSGARKSSSRQKTQQRSTQSRQSQARQSQTRQPQTRTSRAQQTHSPQSRQTQFRQTQTRQAQARSSRPSLQQTQRLDLSAYRKASSKRRKRKKLRLPFIIIGAAVLAALIIILLIAAGGVKETANVKITSTETTQTITWDNKVKNASYEVLQKSPDGSFTVVKTVSADSTPSATIVELNSATEYEYKVRTVKGEGKKQRRSNGVSIRAYTLPAAVTELSFWTEIQDSLTFSWADTQNVAGYELRFGTSDNLSDADTIRLALSDLVVDEGTGNYTYQIENLEERTPYYFSLRSYIDNDTFSSWTETRTARVSRPVDMRGIDVNAPMVALTFDDGPEGSDITTRILDTFAQYGGHATFFQPGDRASSYSDRIKRMVDEGHEVGNHTYDHSHMGDSVTREDIVKANDAIEEAGGVRPVSFRSPGGSTTDLIRETCAEENMALYYWSLDTRDWYTRDADSVISVIKNNIEDGDIILMHNIYGSSAEAVEKIVPWLIDQGYQLVTVSQLLKAKTGDLPVPGTQYVTATQTMN